MSAVCAARSTVSTPIRSSTPSAASGFASVLILKTLHSSTFKVALICIALFGAVVVALFGYVYLSTASYVLDRSDNGIDADHAMLMAAYEKGGSDGLIAVIES